MPNYRRRKELSKKRSRMAKRRWALWRAEREAVGGEVDVDTAHWRTLQDRRGTIWRRWIVQDGEGMTISEIVLRYSVRGRTDQLDLEVHGKPVCRPMGLTRALHAFRKLGLEAMKPALDTTYHITR